MRTIYIDSDYRCHPDNPDNTFREIEHAFFDGKCHTFIGGYCYDDSKDYTQIYPWKPCDELDAAQREYERQKLAEYEESLKVMGVTV